MKKFDFDFFKGHILFSEEGATVLLDTGSPVSFGNKDKIKLFGKEFGLKKNFLGVSADKISEYLGKGIDVILGLDTLKNYNLFLNFSDKTFTLFEDEEEKELELFRGGKLIEVEFSGLRIPLLEDSFPGIEVKVCEEPVEAFIDTGAFQSYIAEECVKEKEPAGKTSDFHPLFSGYFEAELYDVEVGINGYKKNVRIGKLPDIFSKTLSFFGVSMIIGTDILKDFNVLIHFPKKKIIFEI